MWGGLPGGAWLKLSRQPSRERWPELPHPLGAQGSPELLPGHCTRVCAHMCVCVHTHAAPQFSEPAHLVPLFELPSPGRWTFSSASLRGGRPRGRGLLPGLLPEALDYAPSVLWGPPVPPAQYQVPAVSSRAPRRPVGHGCCPLCAGRHGHRQCALQGLHHAGGAPGGGLQPGASRHHQPVRHRWRRQPHRSQHLPQRVGQLAGGAGEGRWGRARACLGWWGLHGGYSTCLAAAEPLLGSGHREDEGRRVRVVGLAQPRSGRPWAAAEVLSWLWPVELESLEPSIRDRQVWWTAVPG